MAQVAKETKAHLAQEARAENAAEKVAVKQVEKEKW
jgi:hypothetical protein